MYAYIMWHTLYGVHCVAYIVMYKLCDVYYVVYNV